jgi:hypothetical protein
VSERCAMLGCRQPASPLPLRVDEPQLPGPFEVALCPEHLEGWERQLGALAGREGELPVSDASWRALQLGAEALRGLPGPGSWQASPSYKPSGWPPPGSGFARSPRGWNGWRAGQANLPWRLRSWALT